MLRIDNQRARSREAGPGADRGFSKSQRRHPVRRRKSSAGLRLGGAAFAPAAVPETRPRGARFVAALPGEDDRPEPGPGNAADRPLPDPRRAPARPWRKISALLLGALAAFPQMDVSPRPATARCGGAATRCRNAFRGPLIAVAFLHHQFPLETVRSFPGMK